MMQTVASQKILHEYGVNSEYGTVNENNRPTFFICGTDGYETNNSTKGLSGLPGGNAVCIITI